MRRTLKYLLYVAMVALLSTFCASKAYAQGSINAYSPCTMYGIGELRTLGSTQQLAMGGMGVAWRSAQMVSYLNPAGLSSTPQKKFILDVGAEAAFMKNRQNLYDLNNDFLRQTQNAKNTVNIHSVAVQFPIYRALGAMISVSPYSSVGYSMWSEEQSEDIWGSAGQIRYMYTGQGDITEVKVGIGWEPFRGFSIGFAGKYYWGNISRDYATMVHADYTTDQTISSIVGTTDFSVNSFKFQLGVQWNALATQKRLLTFGATYDYGGPLKPRVTDNMYLNDMFYTSVVLSDKSNEMRLPHDVTLGVTYQTSKIVLGFDYQYRGWGSNNGYFEEQAYGGLHVTYQDTSTFKFGIDYVPNRFDVRNYTRRVSYRLGFRYGDNYQVFGGKPTTNFAVSAGIGFPLRFLGATSINLSLEYGRNGSLSSTLNDIASRIGLIKQEYFRINLGFSLFGEDYWFVRPKYD
ncbi:MAG: hypothetical protein KBS95_00185 [Alistipes sp.]|nr:hypothetical protein [Candidatus Alistipes equi]